MLKALCALSNFYFDRMLVSILIFLFNNKLLDRTVKKKESKWYTEIMTSFFFKKCKHSANVHFYHLKSLIISNAHLFLQTLQTL